MSGQRGSFHRLGANSFREAAPRGRSLLVRTVRIVGNSRCIWSFPEAGSRRSADAGASALC